MRNSRLQILFMSADNHFEISGFSDAAEEERLQQSFQVKVMNEVTRI